jgi:hypothetical protein
MVRKGRLFICYERCVAYGYEAAYNKLGKRNTEVNGPALHMWKRAVETVETVKLLLCGTLCTSVGSALCVLCCICTLLQEGE